MMLRLAIVATLGLINTGIVGLRASLADAVPKPHLVFMIGEREYGTKDTLPEFFERDLQPLGFRATFVNAPSSGADKNNFKGLDRALPDADLLVISVRRRAPVKAQLDAVRHHLQSGKPVIAIRTASHAFDTRGNAPEGHAEWRGFDREVLGGNYTGHYGSEPCRIAVADSGKDHPLLSGVTLGNSSKLYKDEVTSSDAVLLLTASLANGETEPVAWVNQYGPNDARVFYTSLGLRDDFEQPGFRRLLRNAVQWGLGANIPAEDDDARFQLNPSLSEPTLRVADDLRLDQLLKEPVVANPLHLSFDERGRLWVVQYRQYPWPAGLRLVSRDRVWRNVYDPAFPPPPPHADDSPYRGSDRITIHEDSNGDGVLDKTKVFLDGLNFATAVLRGRGGVYVMNPPYLLFYPDENHDDVPDRQRPDILLSGFGIEDSHSVANSLTWGPDGWIYATQGSTVSAAIRRHGEDGLPIADETPIHTMGQNVWRYHPERHVYEVFAEGGGNAFGVEIDSKGRVYSGHNGGNTRGFHYVQGGYSQKNFGKHGQLSNPYAFAHYQPMKHHSVVRFTHTFCIYEADALPSRYRGLLLGVNPVEHHVILSEIEADGASRKTRDVAVVVEPGEGERARWFTPVDIKLGPDGAIYIADWFSVQANHYRNHQGETNPDLGRVYRLGGRASTPHRVADLSQLATDELIDRYLFHPNRWYRKTTLRLIGDRKDAEVIPKLAKLVHTNDGQRALESLWALNLSGGLSEERALECLDHPDPHVRGWVVRLLGDERSVSPRIAQRLVKLAESEPHVEVRCQLASTAKRLSPANALPIIMQLLQRSEDLDDVYVPNMLWWALETQADDTSTITKAFEDPAAWMSKYQVGGGSLAQNLVRRYAMIGTQQSLHACAELFRQAPSKPHIDALMEGFVRALEGRAMPVLPQSLADVLAKSDGHFALVLAVRQGEAAALEEARRQIQLNEVPDDQRGRLMLALGDAGADPDQTAAALLGVVGSSQSSPLKMKAIAALQRFDLATIGTDVLQRFEDLQPLERAAALTLLSSRVSWSKQLLQAIDDGQLTANQVDAETLARLRLHRDAELAKMLNANFAATINGGDEQRGRMTAFEQIVRAGNGNPVKGRELFHGKVNCAKCHTLFHRGGEIGPDLTAYNRNNLRNLLLAIIQPNAEIREGFENYTVYTDDGRVLTGFKIEENKNLLVLRSVDGQNHAVAAEEIDELAQNPQSIMPSGLLDELSDDEIRDLFAFLTSTTPPL